jgi:AcrR family transcriptional regulator
LLDRHAFGAERPSDLMKDSPQRHRPGTAVFRKGRARAEAILDAATAILVEEGSGALSTRRVAARAGVRPGHLQYYFPARQDLVRALLERYLDRGAAAAERRMSPIPSSAAEARLEVVLDGILADHASPDHRRFLWELWALAAHDPAVAEAMQAFYRSYWRSLVAALLEHEPALGRPRAERRAALLVAMLEGLTLFRSRTGTHELPLPFLERELRSVARKLATDLG